MTARIVGNPRIRWKLIVLRGPGIAKKVRMLEKRMMLRNQDRYHFVDAKAAEEAQNGVDA